MLSLSYASPLRIPSVLLTQATVSTSNDKPQPTSAKQKKEGLALIPSMKNSFS